MFYLVPLFLSGLGIFACEPGCDDMAVASVVVTIVDQDGTAITDAAVVYNVNGGQDANCEDGAEGEWICGYEETGQIEVTAAKSGYTSDSDTVTVSLTEDECHVQSQELELELIDEGGPM
jgi:hypothetical protein